MSDEKITLHHGTCDCCDERIRLVAHFNEPISVEEKDGTRICKTCVLKALIKLVHD